MKFAVNVLNFGPGANPRSLRDWAEFAESAGYHAVMISDHIAVTPDIAARYPEPFYDGFTVLAWLAGITSRVELGTTVTVLPLPSSLAGGPHRLRYRSTQPWTFHSGSRAGLGQAGVPGTRGSVCAPGKNCRRVSGCDSHTLGE